LGLSIDPYTEDEVKREELRKLSEKQISEKPFRAVAPKTIEEKRRPPNYLD
jgi:hypothetical protein